MTEKEPMEETGTTTPPPPQPPEAEAGASSGRMIATMGSIGLIAGALNVFTYKHTFPVIQRNKEIALQRAVLEVVPGATRQRTFADDGGAIVALQVQNETLRKYYAAYDSTGRLAGVAVEAAGQGFQDIVRILYGYSPDCDCIVGMKVLESKETPGLGDKIDKDAGFRANFEALDVQLSDDGEIAHPVTMVKHGEKTEAWQVEAITGATISSRAVANILRESSSQTIPMIEKNLDAFQEETP